MQYNQTSTEQLMFVLRQMVKEQIAFIRSRSGQEKIDEIEVSEKEFAQRALKLDIKSVTSLYKSHAFKSDNFSYDSKRKLIIQNL